MNTATVLKVVLALLVVVVMDTQACSCMRKPFVDFYCDSDFAAKVLVTDVNITEPAPETGLQTAIYTLQVLKSFRAPKSLRNMTEITVKSSASSSCGAHLRQHQHGRCRRSDGSPCLTRYFLTATLYDDGLWTMLCSNIQTPWKYVSKDKRRGLRHTYRNLTC